MLETSYHGHTVPEYVTQRYTCPDTPRTYPPGLAQLRQWVARRGKEPINPHTGQRASVTDPTTWGTLEEARAAVTRYRLDGIGLVLGSGLFGIDLDHCRNPETGELTPEAAAIVARFPMLYWEVSQSSGGLHGIGYGQLPPGRRRRGQIETYDADRFFVMTGNVLPGHETPGEAGEALTAWHRETFPQEPPAEPAQPATLTLDATELLERLQRRANGRAARFLAGDLCGKTSHSEARWALANMACYYTDDPGPIAQLLRDSPLWDSKDRDRNRDRKANHDARRAVSEYTGPRYDPKHSHTFASPQPQPPPTMHAAEPEAPPTDDIDAMSCEEVRALARRQNQTIQRLEAANAELTQERDAARLDRETLLAFSLNQHVTSAEKMAVAAAVDQARRKAPDADGYVTLKPGEIANDWRPKPQPGENTPALNRDGSKPRMNRGSVGKTMKKLTGYGLDAKPAKEEIKPKNGREPYKETVWKIRPKPIAEILAPIAFHQPATIVPRQARTITPQCPDCNVDLENVTVQVVHVTRGECPECGQVHRFEEKSKPRSVQPIVMIYPREDSFTPVQNVVTPTGDSFTPRWTLPRDAAAGSAGHVRAAAP
jgi:primase-polymerase (primpol)-like protein